MKATGITRPIDHLGRVVIPMELRRTMNLKPDTNMEIFVEDGNKIILIPYRALCFCCGNPEQKKLLEYEGVFLCPDCVKKFTETEVES